MQQQYDPENDPPAREASDWATPCDYDGDGSVAAMAAKARRSVARQVPELAKLGSTIICGVRHPHPHTISMTLETPAAVAHANRLLKSDRSGWRLVEIRKTPNF